MPFGKSDNLPPQEEQSGNLPPFSLDSAFLSSSFPNGLRPASPIDQNKVRRSYEARYGEELPTDVELASLLRSSGICDGEKVYFLTEPQKSRLRGTVQTLFTQGHHVLYYSELFHRHAPLLESCHLYEESVLRTVLRNLLPDAVCEESRTLDRPGRSDLEEVLSAFGGETVLSVERIQEHRPYLSPTAVKAVLSSSDRFIWSQRETYALTDRIALAEQDTGQVNSTILPKMLRDGYISLNELSVQESCDRNPGVSPTAVRDAIYLRYMAHLCDRRGVIATPKGTRSSALEQMEAHCRTLERATLRDLRDYRDRHLKGLPEALLIRATCGVMVRAEQELFLGDGQITFDTAATDHAVGLFVNGRIIPITAITSFTSFPEIREGFSWNLYLVESFLRRFSQAYRIDGGPAQISYVGGICPRSMRFDSYDDLLAAVLIQDAVPLNEDAAGAYLTGKKYILRRSRRVRTVLRKAARLQEQRGSDSVQLYL